MSSKLAVGADKFAHAAAPWFVRFAIKSNNSMPPFARATITETMIITLDTRIIRFNGNRAIVLIQSGIDTGLSPCMGGLPFRKLIQNSLQNAAVRNRCA
jgi:hypothetical protein